MSLFSEVIFEAVHIGNHQHQSLRAGEGRSQNTANQGSMERTHGSSLRLRERKTTRAYLHFNDAKRLSEYILATLDCPGISVLSHGRRGSDWENASSFRNVVCRRRSSLVTITCHTNRHGPGGNRLGRSKGGERRSLHCHRSCRSQQVCKHLDRSLLKVFSKEDARDGSFTHDHDPWSEFGKSCIFALESFDLKRVGWTGQRRMWIVEKGYCWFVLVKEPL